jgi:hypothetical protein
MRKLASVLVVLAVVGIVRAGEWDIRRSIEEAGAYVREPGPHLAVGIDETSMDAVLYDLCELRRLGWLMVSKANLTPARMRVIGGLTGLWRVSLNDCICSNAAIRELQRLRGLSELFISDCTITDEGLAGLTELSNLRILFLDGCPNVTDAGLPSLARMKKLGFVDLTGTAVTQAGIAQFQKDLPTCAVQLGEKIYFAKR